jgi:hypothetical protein
VIFLDKIRRIRCVFSLDENDSCWAGAAGRGEEKSPLFETSDHTTDGANEDERGIS